MFHTYWIGEPVSETLFSENSWRRRCLHSEVQRAEAWVMEASRFSAIGLALFLLGSIFVCTGGQLQSIQTDLFALLKIREHLIDTRGILNDWTLEKSAIVCTWRGVVCKDARVYELRLPGAGLKGRIAGAWPPLPFPLFCMHHVRLALHVLLSLSYIMRYWIFLQEFQTSCKGKQDQNVWVQY